MFFVKISKEKLFLMNAVIDVPSIYRTQWLAKLLPNQKRKAHLPFDLFVDQLQMSQNISYHESLINQRYSDDRIDTIIYRYSGNWMDAPKT